MGENPDIPQPQPQSQGENPDNPQSQSQDGKQNPLARVLSAIKAPFGKKS